MPPVIEISSWDAIENTARDVLVVVPPIPRPILALVAEDAVYIVTDGLAVRLVDSHGIIDLVTGARTFVVAEAHEHIVRETMIQVMRINQHLDGVRVYDLEAA